jgi:mitochondrial GTPase 1
MFDLSQLRIHWYPSHMAHGLDAMKRRLEKVHLVVEVRDARIPLSSKNAVFDQLLDTRHKRLVVFNKADLADPQSNRQLGQIEPNSIVMNAGIKSDIRNLLDRIIHLVECAAEASPTRLMIVGIPNVGKSTIINRLRLQGTTICTTSKAVPVGNLPGVTRAVSGLVRIIDSPRVYLHDTPGVLVPRIVDPKVGIKLALTGAIMDSQVNEYVLAEYLLHELNARSNQEYLRFYRIPEASKHDLEAVLNAAGLRMGMLLPGGLPNTSNAAKEIVRRFRHGKLGRMTLDEVGE